MALGALVLGAGYAWWRGSDREGPRRAGPEAQTGRSHLEGQEAADLPPGTVHLEVRQQQAIGLRTAKPTVGEDSHVVTAPGKVAPNETQFAFITPRASGVVRSVAAHVGQEVKVGDLLATIDSPTVGDARLDLYTRLQAQDIARAQAEWQATIYQNTQELIARLKKNESPQQIHEVFTDKPVGENREKLLTAYAQYRLAVATFERNRELFAQNLITPKQFQQVNADYEVAQATYQSLMDQMGFDTRLANTRAQQGRKQAETAVRAAQERLRILGVKADGTEPEVQRGKVVGVRPDAPAPDRPEGPQPSAESVVNTADAPVSTYSIWAPFDGIILDREMIVPGVTVDASKQIFTLADLSSVYVEAHIHENEFGSLARSRGGVVKFHSPAYPGRVFDGQVIYAGDLVDETSRTVKLLARAENPDRLLKPGMFVTVEIHSGQATSSLQVPASAVLTQGERSFVFVAVGPDRFTRREVRVNGDRDDRVIVLSGLEPADRVVTEGAFKLKALASHGASAPQ